MNAGNEFLFNWPTRLELAGDICDPAIELRAVTGTRYCGPIAIDPPSPSIVTGVAKDIMLVSFG